ncbi:uncharacterized protein LOC120351659 [Nilaparvata lugens]|uniref:uncharacterized protein LOC120351659 n=1 Tax=Nilaparvata lugens TaxID=108931 RepID=UPI00193E4025|nr:uncharacterized protein LOC120351659 [Nilaparvata lugens]
MTVTNIYNIMEVITHVSRLNLQRGTDVHKYVTRQADNYVLPRHRTAIFEEKPSYVGRKLWNHLPEKIKRLDCVTLKKRLSEFLKGRPMYELCEFLETGDRLAVNKNIILYISSS